MKERKLVDRLFPAYPKRRGRKNIELDPELVKKLKHLSDQGADRKFISEYFEVSGYLIYKHCPIPPAPRLNFNNLNKEILKRIIEGEDLVDIVIEWSKKYRTRAEMAGAIGITGITLSKFIGPGRRGTVPGIARGSRFPERDKKIAEEYPELTLQEIGDKFGLTRERIRQILERDGVDRLRNYSRLCGPTTSSRATCASSRPSIWGGRIPGFTSP